MIRKKAIYISNMLVRTRKNKKFLKELKELLGKYDKEFYFEHTERKI